MTGPVEFLEAAHKQAEETAQAATPGPWVPGRLEFDPEGFEACVGTAQIPQAVAGQGPSGGGIERWADAVHITLHDPAAVLRRIAAERKQLALHHPVANHGRYSDEYGDECPDWCDGEHPQELICRTCRNYAGDPTEAPCDSLEALAEGWGWTSVTGEPSAENAAR